MDRASRWVLRLPGRFLPIVRVSIAFLFASFVLVLIAIYSNFSETLVVAGMLFVTASLPTYGRNAAQDYSVVCANDRFLSRLSSAFGNGPNG